VAVTRRSGEGERTLQHLVLRRGKRRKAERYVNNEGFVKERRIKPGMKMPDRSISLSPSSAASLYIPAYSRWRSTVDIPAHVRPTLTRRLALGSLPPPRPSRPPHRHHKFIRTLSRRGDGEVTHGHARERDARKRAGIGSNP
jgi:hypothetical protein